MAISMWSTSSWTPNPSDNNQQQWTSGGTNNDLNLSIDLSYLWTPVPDKEIPKQTENLSIDINNISSENEVSQVEVKSENLEVNIPEVSKVEENYTQSPETTNSNFSVENDNSEAEVKSENLEVNIPEVSKVEENSTQSPETTNSNFSVENTNSENPERESWISLTMPQSVESSETDSQWLKTDSNNSEEKKSISNEGEVQKPIMESELNIPKESINYETTLPPENLKISIPEVSKVEENSSQTVEVSNSALSVESTNPPKQTVSVNSTKPDWIDLTAISMQKIQQTEPVNTIPQTASAGFDLDSMIMQAWTVNQNQQAPQVAPVYQAETNYTVPEITPNVIPQNNYSQPIQNQIPQYQPQQNTYNSQTVQHTKTNSSKWRKIVSFIIFIVVLVVGRYVIKTVYPVEYKSIVNKITGSKTENTLVKTNSGNELLIPSSTWIVVNITWDNFSGETLTWIIMETGTNMEEVLSGEVEVSKNSWNNVELPEIHFSADSTWVVSLSGLWLSESWSGEFDPFAEIDSMDSELAKQEENISQLNFYLEEWQKYYSLAQEKEATDMYKCWKILTLKTIQDIEILEAWENIEDEKLQQHFEIFEECIVEMQKRSENIEQSTWVVATWTEIVSEVMSGK